MARVEIDADKVLWTLPAARSKNHMTHTIPLAPGAFEIVQEALVCSRSDTYVFPARTDRPCTTFTAPWVPGCPNPTTD
jgi:hypothetical protein